MPRGKKYPYCRWCNRRCARNGICDDCVSLRNHLSEVHGHGRHPPEFTADPARRRRIELLAAWAAAGLPLH